MGAFTHLNIYNFLILSVKLLFIKFLLKIYRIHILKSIGKFGTVRQQKIN